MIETRAGSSWSCYVLPLSDSAFHAPRRTLLTRRRCATASALRASCIRHTRQPRIAGLPQGAPVRFERAVHRGAACALCKGFVSPSVIGPPVPALPCRWY